MVQAANLIAMPSLTAANIQDPIAAIYGEELEIDS